MGCSVIFRGIDPCDHPTMCLRGHENTIMSPVTKSNGDGRKGKVVHDDAGKDGGRRREQIVLST